MTVDFVLVGRYKIFKLGWEKSKYFYPGGGGKTRRTPLYLVGRAHELGLSCFKVNHK